MARARNLKPGFFKNENLAECSPWARLCFAGLWTLADREGRLEDRPKRIKGELFAFDSIEVEPLLAELAKYGFIRRYEAEDGRGLIQVTEFCKHQNPHHREPESDLPPPKSLGLAQVANKAKPEAQQACDNTQAPGQPRASPGFDPTRSDLARGSSRAESGIDESGTLIPEKRVARKRAAPPSVVSVDDLAADGVDRQHATDWLAVRKAKHLPLTPTAWADAKAEAKKAGLSIAEAVKASAANGWGGFRASWLAGRDSPQNAGRKDDVFAGAH